MTVATSGVELGAQRAFDVAREAYTRGAQNLVMDAGTTPLLTVNKRGLTLPDPIVTNENLDALFEFAIDRASIDASEGEKKQLRDRHRARVFGGVTGSTDIGFSHPLLGRIRMNVMLGRGDYTVAMRFLRDKLFSLRELGAHQTMYNALAKGGLIVITAPVDHGKNTLGAAIVEDSNQNSVLRIITLEDPIEALFTNKLSRIFQRELGRDYQSTAEALHGIARQPYDALYVAEGRDADTMRAALQAAHRGKAVILTVHVNNPSDAIDYIINQLPHQEERQARTILSTALRAIYGPRLLPRARAVHDGEPSMVLAHEVMWRTSGLSDLIRMGDNAMLAKFTKEHVHAGMRPLEQHLAQLVAAGDVRDEDARKEAPDVEYYERMLSSTPLAPGVRL